MKTAIVLAFVTNTLLGSFCMMPMAMAAEMPTHSMDAVGDLVTPMAPTSHADCDSCSHHEEKKEPLQKSCADHCFDKAAMNNPSSTVSGSSELVAALPAALPVIWNATTDSQMLPLIHGPPPPIHITTVVMRL